MQTFSEVETKTASRSIANNLANIKPVPLKTPAVQTQLKIGKPNDEYEQEADQVADRVMSMPESSIQQQPIEEEEEMAQPKSMFQLQPVEEEEDMLQTKPILQMQPIEEEEMLQAKQMIQMQVEEKEEEMLQTKPMLQLQPMEEEEEMLQPKWIQMTGCTSCGEREIPDLQTNTHKIQLSPLSHINSCGGQPMPDSTRSFFEPRFGHSFKNVRVHTCDSAVQMNQQLGAQAFTYGNNIFFNKGKYKPESSEGKKLMAHELTHVVQQNGGLKRIDQKRQIHIQPYRANKGKGKQKISSAPQSVQRALPVAAALAIACAIGAIVGMLLDWGIMYGISRWRGRQYRHDWCGTILAGVLGCLGGMSAAAIETYMLRTGVRIVSGPIIGRILTWLVARGAVFFPKQSARMLLQLGCINEEQHEAITA